MEIVEDGGRSHPGAARDELIRQAAQGEVLHNDDTSMRVLRLAREPSDDRTGVFTSGIFVRSDSPSRASGRPIVERPWRMGPYSDSNWCFPK